MSLETVSVPKQYAGNSSTTAFAYPYKFFADGDLVVILKVDSTGVETTQTITTHYTVAGSGLDAGGTVTMVTAPATGETLTIYRDPTATQSLDLVENDALPAEEAEKAWDRNTMLIQRSNELHARTVKLSDGFSDTFDLTLPSDLATANITVAVNPAGDGFVSGPTITAISDAAAEATAAAASASAALVSENNAQDWATKTNGQVESTDYSSKAFAIGGTGVTNTSGAGAAKEWATKAEDSTVDTSGYSALHHAAKAAASATLAANSAASVIWNDVIFLTNSDSPYTVTNSQRGAMLAVDCSSGAVTINLPSIAALDLTSPFVLGIKKTDSSGNSITVARNGTDTIDSGTSKTLGVTDAGSTFIPDTDTSPDEWTTADFGSSAGNFTVDQFSGDGSTTGFTLSVAPGSENNTSVYITGIYQEKDEYSVSGTTLTFSAAPPTGTNNIEVMSGTTLSIGTPSDATVTTAKIADANVTKAKLADGANANKSVVSKTTTATLLVTDQIVLASTAGGAYTITLPTAVGNSGLEFHIKKTTSDVNALTIDGNASETINSIASVIIPRFNNFITIVSDGSNWHIINEQRTIRVEASGNAGAAITQLTERMDWDTVEDICSLWTQVSGNGNDTFTAKEEGMYQFKGNAAWTANHTNRMYYYLNNDGAGYTKLLYDGASVSQDHHYIDLIVYLAVGDIVDFRVSNTATLQDTTQDHWLEIIKLN